MLPVILGIAVSFLLKFIIKKGKVRNPKLATILALLLSVFTFYLAFVFWVDLAYNYNQDSFSESINISGRFEGIVDLLKDPAYFFSLVKEININGVWSLSDITVKGIGLSAIWVLEFLIFMFFGTMFAKDTANNPFEESSETWYEEKILVGKSFVEDVDNMVAYLETGQDDVFENFRNVEDHLAESHSTMFIYTSRNEGNYLTINNKFAKLNDKNEVVFDAEEIIKNVYISNKVVDSLINM